MAADGPRSGLCDPSDEDAARRSVVPMAGTGGSGGTIAGPPLLTAPPPALAADVPADAAAGLIGDRAGGVGAEAAWGGGACAGPGGGSAGTGPAGVPRMMRARVGELMLQADASGAAGAEALGVAGGGGGGCALAAPGLADAFAAAAFASCIRSASVTPPKPTRLIGLSPPRQHRRAVQ